MRHFIPTTLFLALGLMSCGIGEQTLDIKYDFQKGLQEQTAYKIRYLGRPSITITNFNPRLYNVSINEKQTSVVFEEETNGTVKSMMVDGGATYIQPIARGDEIAYTVKITEIADTANKTIFPLTVRVGGRIKIDVSSGINFMMGTSDEQYQLDSTTFKFSEVDDQNFSIPTSITVMTHIYPKQTGQINIGGSLGLGINDNGKVRYFGGLGLMFGDRQRAILNIGAVLSQKKVLNDRYDKEKPLSSSALPTDLLVDAWRLGGFVGISYNLTSTEK